MSTDDGSTADVGGFGRGTEADDRLTHHRVGIMRDGTEATDHAEGIKLLREL